MKTTADAPAASSPAPIAPPPAKPWRVPLITRRAFLRIGAAGVVGLAAAGWGFGVEPGWIATERHTLALPRLPVEFAGLKLAHISDIHMDEWMTAERVADIVARVNAETPDVIAITGDFVTHSPARFAPLLTATLAPLSAPLGVFAVLGNHDHWTHAPTVHAALTAAGITVLRNAVVPISRDRATMVVAGVDDVWVKRHDLEAVIQQLSDNDNAPAILLAHEPDFAVTAAATGRFDLQLSGHSHGGQVVVPIYGPPVLPRLGKLFPAGHYSLAGMQLYTTRGLGMIPPRVRLNCRPEITILTLIPA